MECHALYTLAAKHSRRALTVCTVFDHIPTGGVTTTRRERAFRADGEDRPRRDARRPLPA